MLIFVHMVYIIESGKYFKIGYSSHWSNRSVEYKTHNPSFKVVALLKGDKLLELKLQKTVEQYLHYGEWFIKFKGYKKHILTMYEQLKKCDKPYCAALKRVSNKPLNQPKVPEKSFVQVLNPVAETQIEDL